MSNMSGGIYSFGSAQFFLYLKSTITKYWHKHDSELLVDLPQRSSDRGSCRCQWLSWDSMSIFVKVPLSGMNHWSSFTTDIGLNQTLFFPNRSLHAFLSCLLGRRIKHKSEFNQFPFMARWWAPNTSTFIMSDEGKTDFPSVGVSEHIILCVGFFFPFFFFSKSSKSAYLCLFHLPIWLACSLARPPV